MSSSCCQGLSRTAETAVLHSRHPQSTLLSLVALLHQTLAWPLPTYSVRPVTSPLSLEATSRYGACMAWLAGVAVVSLWPHVASWHDPLQMKGLQVSGATDSAIVVTAGALHLHRMTLTNNFQSSSSGGGALRVSGSGSLVQLFDQVAFVGNSASSGKGGAAWLGEGTTLAMAQSSTATMSANTAQSGGAVYCDGCTVVGGDHNDEALHISSNVASTVGGGVECEGSCTLTKHTRVTDNTATTSGGGMYLHKAATLTVDSCSISGNTASSAVTGHGGGGVFVDDGAVFEYHPGPSASDGGVDISSCKSANAGGGLYLASAAIVRPASSPTPASADALRVSDNCACMSGGGIFAAGTSGTISVASAVVDSNKAFSACCTQAEIDVHAFAAQLGQTGGAGVSISAPDFVATGLRVSGNSLASTIGGGSGRRLVSATDRDGAGVLVNANANAPGTCVVTLEAGEITSNVGNSVSVRSPCTLQGSSTSVVAVTATVDGAGVVLAPGATLADARVHANADVGVRVAGQGSSGALVARATIEDHTTHGGVEVEATLSLELRDTAVRNNIRSDRGGGISVHSQVSLVCSGTTLVSGNTAPVGSGVWCAGCASISGLDASKNVAANADSASPTTGGGLAVIGARPTGMAVACV